VTQNASSCPSITPTACFETNPATVSPPKNLGNTGSSCSANSSNRIFYGNPINIGTGNKYQFETDYQGAGDFPLVFDRTYNSDASTFSEAFSFGSGWRHSYERLIVSTGNSALMVTYRPDGRAYTFSLVGSNWLPVADVNLQLNRSTTPDGWLLTTEDGSVETYDANGKLQSIKSLAGAAQTLTYDSNSGLLSSVIHSNGRRLNFTYDGNRRLVGVLDPSDSLYRYGYDANGNLASVTYPDQTPADLNDNPKKTYLYGELANTANASQPHALTGIIDENNNRFATWTYDAQGRAISSQHAGGAEAVSVSYGTGSSTVTDALGTARTNSLQIVQGVVKSGGQSQPAGAGCSAAASNISYDANGNTASRTDFNGNLSCYAYDLSRNLETVRVEGLAPGSNCPADLAAYTPAANGSERKISTQWHASYRLPTQIDQAGQRQSFSYDSAGNLLQKTVTDTATQQSRRWTYTYNSLGQILSEDGPRTDVADLASYTYYADSAAGHKPGDLWKIANALGHVTTFTAYDANGRLLSLTDPNGLVIGFAYDPRGRLSQKTVDGNATRYDYDPAGNLVKITKPSGVYFTYTYDDAHRLTGVADALGGRIHYTLDLMGNRTKEEIFDANGTAVKTHSRQFDALSRLQQDIGAYNQTTRYQYDANGNLTQRTDAEGHATQHQYDSLNRLIRSTDALAGLTDYHYDGQDRLTQVTDANNHSTVYTYNGLGDLTQLDSPNTGLSQYGYDSAGNLASKTDAGNVTASYQYDALNRLLGIDYPGTEADVVNTYDTPADGPAGQLGRLHSSRRDTITTVQSYDLRGNQTLSTVQNTSNGNTASSISYRYNADDRLVETQPSADRTIQNLFDAAGQIQRIQIVDTRQGGNETRILADAVTHLPFGPVKSLSYGNGLTLSRNYDQDYQLTGQSVQNTLRLAYYYNAVGNLTSLYDFMSSDGSRNYGYDPLNRLISEGGRRYRSYNYDAVDNRIYLFDYFTGTLNNVDYHYDLSNQQLLDTRNNRHILNTIVVDSTNYATNPQGHINQIGGRSLNYSADQRLSSISQDGATLGGYGYDAFGRRIAKTISSGSTYYGYGLDDRLLSETKGTSNQHYAYLDGQPLARIDDTGASSNIYYYHNNAIGAPLKVSNQSGQLVWSAYLSPFGQAETINPNITQNLRLPGQYFDAETGWHYNMQRYYDPGLGRYLQSDPIGLMGGVNTYTYVSNNPVNWVDPLGLWSNSADGGAVSCFGCHARWYNPEPSYPVPDNSIMEARGKNFGKHHPTLPIVNPGKDCDGNCNPCPPGIAPFQEPGNEHGSTSGFHWHKIEYNQNKQTCECFPVSRDSGDGVNWK
jgi:RHS repeat-associated protein